jgi:hypothetical protein
MAEFKKIHPLLIAWIGEAAKSLFFMRYLYFSVWRPVLQQQQQ